MAVGVAVIGHISGKKNISDLLTKPLGPAYYYKFLSGPLFGRKSWGDHTSGVSVEWNGLFCSFRMMCDQEEKGVLCR